MPNRRHFLSSLALAALVASSNVACAATPSIVDMQIVDRDANRVLPLWRQGSESYVAGQPGSRYALRLTNRSGARVMVVLSVDGVNAVTGDTASTSQSGYVLSPWESYDVIGWRKTNAEAAAFYFTSLSDSYAGRTGRPDNVGVIGAAVFRERVIALPPPALSRQPFEESPSVGSLKDRSSARDDSKKDSPSTLGLPAPSSRAAAAEAMSAPALAAKPSLPAAGTLSDAGASRRERAPERLGTGHGEREYSPITSVAFERASSRPDAVVSIRYDSYERLLASGVVPRAAVAVAPNPFPSFVPDPR